MWQFFFVTYIYSWVYLYIVVIMFCFIMNCLFMRVNKRVDCGLYSAYCVLNLSFICNVYGSVMLILL